MHEGENGKGSEQYCFNGDVGVARCPIVAVDEMEQS
jgi:hypothetical protein